MDPLSIAASAITVAALATSTCRTFSELRSFCSSLPDRLHALNNEVADTEIVLAQLAAVFNKRTSLIEEAEYRVTLELLSQASVALSQLQDILKESTALCDRSKFVLIQARAWRKEQPHLERLQADIKRVKCTLGIMLGASNSYEQPSFHVYFPLGTSCGRQGLTWKQTRYAPHSFGYRANLCHHIPI